MFTQTCQEERREQKAKEGNLHEFKAILVHTVSSRTVRAKERSPVSKNKQRGEGKSEGKAQKSAPVCRAHMCTDPLTHTP